MCLKTFQRVKDSFGFTYSNMALFRKTGRSGECYTAFDWSLMTMKTRTRKVIY